MNNLFKVPIPFDENFMGIQQRIIGKRDIRRILREKTSDKRLLSV